MGGTGFIKLRKNKNKKSKPNQKKPTRFRKTDIRFSYM